MSFFITNALAATPAAAQPGPGSAYGSIIMMVGIILINHGKPKTHFGRFRKSLLSPIRKFLRTTPNQTKPARDDYFFN